MADFKLEEYLTGGVKNIVKGILRATVKNPSASKFMMQYSMSSKEASRRRENAEKEGRHIPPFLIASITTSCNLHCKGCYARANHNCFDDAAGSKPMLTAEKWNDIFTEAENLGVSFILLAGGEPMLRRDVIEVAALHKKILFPIFTNGTMFEDSNMELIERNPNLVPILSIEGDAEITNGRRGEGIYEKLAAGMERMHKEGITFGSSITVQKDNLNEVMSESFVETLKDKGCKAAIYVEYVPVMAGTEVLAPDDSDREYMKDRLTYLRERYPEMVFISFPGDEKTSGGCLAAGRGFFHINAFGGAEPCPFSAYSDTSLENVSLAEALESPLFIKLRDSGALIEEHKGGCVLFEKEEEVRRLCQV